MSEVFHSCQRSMTHFYQFASQIYKTEASLKVAFFRKCDVFFKSPNLEKKKYSKKLHILNLKFKFPANNTLLFWAENLNFKFRIVFIFFWRFGKQITLSGKSQLQKRLESSIFSLTPPNLKFVRPPSTKVTKKSSNSLIES